jgi:hypothetical protein
MHPHFTDRKRRNTQWGRGFLCELVSPLTVPGQQHLATPEYDPMSMLAKV